MRIPALSGWVVCGAGSIGSLWGFALNRHLAAKDGLINGGQRRSVLNGGGGSQAPLSRQDPRVILLGRKPLSNQTVRTPTYRLSMEDPCGGHPRMISLLLLSVCSGADARGFFWCNLGLESGNGVCKGVSPVFALPRWRLALPAAGDPVWFNRCHSTSYVPSIHLSDGSLSHFLPPSGGRLSGDFKVAADHQGSRHG